MLFLTEKRTYIFIVFTIIFGILEVIDKIFFTIVNFFIFDIGGILVIVVFSTLFLIWEMHKVVLSYYPTVVVLKDLGGNFYGIESEQTGTDGNPVEGKLIVTLQRKGQIKGLIKPRKLSFKTREQFEIHYVEGGFLQLKYDVTEDFTSEGFVYRHFTFGKVTMEEEMLNYSFKIRCRKNANDSTQPLTSYALPNITMTLEYGFGFRKPLPAKEHIEIRIK